MANPVYGDFDAACGTSVQRLGFGYPEPTTNDFHGIITATPATGKRTRDQEQTINRGAFQRPAKPGKWENVITITYHLTVQRLIKLFAAMVGAVAKAVLSAGAAYRFTITPSVSRTDERYHTIHLNRNGRVYTHYDGEALSWGMQSAAFWDCSMEIGATKIAHCQAFPTTSVNNTYTGLCYAFGQYLHGDDDDTTYQIEVNVSGVTGVAEARTRKVGNAAWSANQIIHEGRKIYVRDEDEVDSGMFVIFKRGGPAFLIVNYNVGAGDTATITVNGTPTILTEGSDFNRGASDAACGQALADAINANATLAASVVAYYKLYPGSVDRVVVIPKDPDDTVTLATSDALAWSVAVTMTLGNTWTAGGSPDAWTLNSRGIVLASSVTDNTVFSANSYEVEEGEMTYDGEAFEVEPQSISVAYARGKKRDEYGLTSPYKTGHPRTTFDGVSGMFKARSQGARYLQDSNNNVMRSFTMALIGKLIGATPYREKFKVEVPNLIIDPGVMEGLSQEYINYHDCPWNGHGETDEDNEAVIFYVDTDEPDLTV